MSKIHPVENSADCDRSWRSNLPVLPDESLVSCEVFDLVCGDDARSVRSSRASPLVAAGLRVLLSSGALLALRSDGFFHPVVDEYGAYSQCAPGEP